MRVRVPGDKSLTQRGLILSSLAEGRSRLCGLLHGGDAASTAGALRALGARLPEIPPDGSELVAEGLGLRGLRAPTGALDLGNSGTGTRLLLGVLAGSGISATLTGDASLRSRPMARVTVPLSQMGARFEAEAAETATRLPITVHGAHPLRPLDWSSPVASAQVKSALLLAGLTGRAFVMVTEPRMSRDHTERLLSAVGAPVVSHAVAEGWRVELREPPEAIPALDLVVPGDFSSAAFLIGLAVLGGGPPELSIESVGLNPTRTALLDVLARMGAAVDRETTSAPDAPEPLGDLTIRPAPLRGVSVDPLEVPRLIDELPLVAVLGARAEGTTRITGAAELRAKESDRIRAVVDNLRAIGVETEELEDGLEVRGTDRPLAGLVRAHGDHRIAMAFGVLAAAPGGERIEIDDPAAADVSFPGFWSLLERVRREGGA